MTKKTDELTTVLGKMLRTFRVVQGWDLRTAADHMDISAPTLMRIEHGRAMDAATWLKIQTFMMRKTVRIPDEV